MVKDKIKKLKELEKIVATLKKKGEKVVFTNGCFDILHLGHIRYLEKARSLGDKLIVAINSDSSVRRLKGNRRPIFSQTARAHLVAALAFVDYVTVFGKISPLRLIKTLKPDVLVKGGDWSKSNIVGEDYVKSYGGKVIVTDFFRGSSTSAIIAKIKGK